MGDELINWAAYPWPWELDNETAAKMVNYRLKS